MATFQDYSQKIVSGGQFSANISASGNLSQPLNVWGTCVLGFFIPSNFTTSMVSFQASINGIDFFTLKDGYSGNPITISCTPNDFSRVLPSDFVGVQFVKLLCETPQINSVVIPVICGPVF